MANISYENSKLNLDRYRIRILIYLIRSRDRDGDILIKFIIFALLQCLKVQLKDNLRSSFEIQLD
jgi:hypothetical protein